MEAKPFKPLKALPNIKALGKAPVRKPSAFSAKMSVVMREFAEGKLKAIDGTVVTDRNQALAIGYSENKAAGNKPPQKRK